MSTPMNDTGTWPPHAMDTWVPHRGGMSLLDDVVRCDDESIEARVRVPADGLFNGDDGVPAWVGIEYMAQAVAAWSGARNARGRRIAENRLPAGQPPLRGPRCRCFAVGARTAASSGSAS